MDGCKSVSRIAQVIRDSGAQIACLQEVTQGSIVGLGDQPKELAELLGMSYVFQCNAKIGLGKFGNAILTSYDIAYSHSHRLTSIGEQRGLLEVGIQTPNGPIAAFCTHLGLNSNERIVQAREIANIVNDIPGHRLLCGDFNEESHSAAVSSLIEMTGFKDAHPGGSPTFDSVNPNHRIDMIFCDSSIEVISTSIIQTQASDHLPLIADIEIA